MKVIPLTQGKVALVDESDYSELIKFKWFAKRRHYNDDRVYYAARSINYIRDGVRCTDTMFMHRQILGLPKGRHPQADHKDGDGLNNQRYNLRVTDSAGNNWNRHRMQGNNTTGYTGVMRRGNKWGASIMIRGKLINLGTYATKEGAAAAYASKHSERAMMIR